MMTPLAAREPNRAVAAASFSISMERMSAELISANGFCWVVPEVASIETIIPSTTYSGVVLLEMEDTPRTLMTGAAPTDEPVVEIITPDARPCNIPSTEGPGMFLMASPFTDEMAPVRLRVDAVP